MGCARSQQKPCPIEYTGTFPAIDPPVQFGIVLLPQTLSTVTQVPDEF
jgi:hypothetical protein